MISGNGIKKYAKSVRRWAREAGYYGDDDAALNISLLHRAAFFGRIQEVKDLLQAGADINARDTYGWIPLHDAAMQGHAEIVYYWRPVVH